MEGCKVGSSTPLYSQVVASRGKKPIETAGGPLGEGKRNIEEEHDLTNTREDNIIKENEEEDKKQETKKMQKGPCKPKAEVTPRVVLNNPLLLAHRDHMRSYAIISKFMGVWPT